MTRAKVCIIKGDPKTELLKHYAPEELPAEYGGNCGKCEHNPDCIKEWDISDIVSKLDAKESEMEFLKENIKAGKTFVKELEGDANTVFGKNQSPPSHFIQTQNFHAVVCIDDHAIFSSLISFSFNFPLSFPSLFFLFGALFSVCSLVCESC